MSDEKKEEKKPRRRIKKVKGHGGHHGGAWKVAYADFVTAMMALFLVLWLVSQADSKVKEQIASYFRSPGVFDTVKGGILPNNSKVSKQPEDLTFQAEDEALFVVSEVLRKAFDSRDEKLGERVKIELTEEGLRIQIIDKAEKVSFPSGSAELNSEAREIIGEIAHQVCNLPNPILVGGHTDKHVFSDNSAYTNWELSTDRANAARRALTEECVKPEQIKRVVGYADTEPLVTTNPYAAANRRISITILRLAQQNGVGQKPKPDLPNPKELDINNKVAGGGVGNSKNAQTEKSKIDSALAHDKPGGGGDESVERRTAKAKLANEGAVQVGEADRIPTSAKKIVEPASSHSD